RRTLMFQIKDFVQLQEHDQSFAVLCNSAYVPCVDRYYFRGSLHFGSRDFKHLINLVDQNSDKADSELGDQDAGSLELVLRNRFKTELLLHVNYANYLSSQVHDAADI